LITIRLRLKESASRSGMVANRGAVVWIVGVLSGNGTEQIK
jgi:hypothetical protein